MRCAKFASNLKLLSPIRLIWSGGLLSEALSMRFGVSLNDKDLNKSRRFA